MNKYAMITTAEDDVPFMALRPVTKTETHYVDANGIDFPRSDVMHVAFDDDTILEGEEWR